MEFWERIHWFFTSQCNERCRFCFKPDFDCGSADAIEALTEMLVDNKVREVIFTGGEPLISKSLDPTLETLHNNGIDTSIHTNATLLTSARIRDLTSLLDEIAIPLDSLNRTTQGYLRRRDCLPQIKKVLRQLQDASVRIGVHTVATSLNTKDIPRIYDFLCKGRFDYWRIYEFNPEIIFDRMQNISRFQEIEMLRGQR